MLLRYAFVFRLFAFAGFVAASVLLSQGVSLGQEDEVVHGGEIEFRRNCVACHGTGGEGDGPMAQLLKVKPADLTKLRKRNNGTFPFWRVYGIIDGRQQVQAHGPREMPIWGDRFQKEAEAQGRDAGSLVAGRILGLVFYLRHIQEE